MGNKTVKIGNYSVKIVYSNEITFSAEDKDMDKRVKAAVRSAIYKATVCEKPIAKYNIRKKKHI